MQFEIFMGFFAFIRLFVISIDRCVFEFIRLWSFRDLMNYTTHLLKLKLLAKPQRFGGSHLNALLGTTIKDVNATLYYFHQCQMKFNS